MTQNSNDHITVLKRVLRFAADDFNFGFSAFKKLPRFPSRNLRQAVSKFVCSLEQKVGLGETDLGITCNKEMA